MMDYVEHALARLLMRNRYDTAGLRFAAKALSRTYMDSASRISFGTAGST